MTKFYSVGFEATDGLLFEDGVKFDSFACKEAVEECLENTDIVDFDTAVNDVMDYGMSFYPADNAVFAEFKKKLDLIAPLNPTGKWIVWGAETDWSMGFMVGEE